MTQVAQTLDIHTRTAQERAHELPGNQVDWVQELRERGLATYQELGWPTTKVEAWKYTSLREVEATEFQPSPASRLAAEELEPFLFDAETVLLAFVNGTFSPEHSNLAGLPDGVTVAPLSTVLEGTPERLQGSLGEIASLDEAPFVGLNTASFQDGAFIDVPDGTVVDTPIHVLFATTGDATPTVTHPRTLITAGRSSEVSIIESYIGLGEADRWTNGVTEIDAGENATVRHVKLQRETAEAVHIATQAVRQARASNVRSHAFTFGGKLVRNNVHAELIDEGCDAMLNGLYLGQDEQHIDNFTVIDHKAPHCESHQLYKSILDDASQGVFRGTIFVAKGAQKTDAYQHNPNLLLSRKALANSVPQLEIFADDVKCSHGSTTGQLDDEWVHYMRARGIDEETAVSMLTYAFAGEVIELVEITPARELVRALVLDRLPEQSLLLEGV